MSTLAAIKLCAVVALALLIFFGGRSCGVQSMQAHVAQQERVLAAKNRALLAASRSFAEFAATFRSISAHTARLRAEGERRAELDRQAAAHAGAAQAAADARVRELEQDLAAARRRRPACAQLFDADLGEACGVTLR